MPTLNKVSCILVETFFSNFNLDRTEALSAATLYSRHLAETTSRMNKANGLSTNCFGDETQHFFFASIERLDFNLVLNFERLCFVYIFTPVVSQGSCA